MNGNSKLKLSVAIAYLFLIIVSIQYSFINTKLEFTGMLSLAFFAVESAIFLGYLFARKYNFRTLLIIAILLVIAGITYYKTGYTSFMIMIMTAIVFDKVEYTNAFRMIFYTRLIMMLVIILMSLVGILDIYKRYIVKSSGSISTIGYGLGFTHPNRLAYVFLFIILVYICYINKKMKAIHFVSLFVFGIVGYSITKSRTLLYSVIGVLLLINFYRIHLFNNLIKKCLNILSVVIMPVCAAVSIIIPMLMLRATGRLQTILYAINGLFSSRFTHIYRAFLNYPVTMFGGTNQFDALENIYNYSTVDNGYVRLLYEFGIIGFLIFILFFVISIKKIINKGEYVYAIVFIIVSLWGINENILYTFAFNFCVVFWSELLKTIPRDRYDKGGKAKYDFK